MYPITLRTLVVSLLIVGAGSASAFAGPTFKGGRVTWKSVTTLRIDFSIQGSWRRDVYTGANGQCINPLTLGVTACSGADGLPDIGDVIVENVGGTTFNTGDGSSIGSPLGSLLYLVTSVDHTANLIYGSALDPAALPSIDVNVTHTYQHAGVYRAFLSGSDRMGVVESSSMHVNNGGQPYRLETLVNVGAVASASPLAATAPIVKCVIDAACSFPIAAVDTTGSGLQFRMSSDFEAGPEGQFLQPGPPHATAATIDAASGVVTWDTTGATLAAPGFRTFYSTQVTIESLTPAITGSIPPPITGPAPVTDTIASKIALDFLIELVEASGTAPVFNSGTGSVGVATVGKRFRLTVVATDAENQTLSLNAFGLPAGSAFDTDNGRRRRARGELTWTPTPDQVGSHQIAFVVTDSSGMQQVGTAVVTVGPAKRPKPAASTTSQDEPASNVESVSEEVEPAPQENGDEAN